MDTGSGDLPSDPPLRPIVGKSQTSPKQQFGIALIIIAVVLGYLGYDSLTPNKDDATTERFIRQLSQASQGVIDEIKRANEIRSLAGQLNGRDYGPSQGEEEIRKCEITIAENSAKLEKMEKERKERMMIFAGIGALFFLSGIILVAAKS